MKRLKKIINLMLCFVLYLGVTLTFSACAKVNATIITNLDGSIDEIVTITLNEEDILNAGENLGQIKATIENKSKNEALNMVQKLDSKINYDLILTSDFETITTLESYRHGMEVVASEWIENTYSVGVRYKDINVYKYYYNVTASTQTNIFTKKSFFYDKVYYYASTMYVKHEGLYANLNEYFSLKYPDFINNENNQLLYTYRTEYRRQHSDANYIYYEDGTYCHTWIIDKDNLEKPIMFYYNIANPENWIIVGLIVTLCLTMVFIIVGVIITKLKKDNE